MSRLKTLAWTLIIGLCAIAAMQELSFAAPAPSSGVVDFAAPAAIISIAQHARPNVAGHMLLRRDHLTRSSSRPVKKL